MKKYFAIALGLLAIAACQKQGTEVVATDTPIRFSVKQNIFTFTKATESALEDADQIQIIAGAPVNAASKATVSGENLTLTTPMYWINGQTASTNFVAIYPYNSSTSTTVEYNLNLGGNHDYDYHKLYLVAKATSAPTDEKVALNFRHPFSKILVNVNNQLGSDAVETVKLKNIKMEGVLDLIAEDVDNLGEDVDVTAAKLSDTQWGAIVMPQSAQPTLEVTTALGSKYNFVLPAAFDFDAGKVATASVTLKGQGGGGDEPGDAIAFSFSVTDWAAADENPGFEDGDVQMGEYWYALGCLYEDDNTIGAWSKDFPLTYKGKDNDLNDVWEITINYDETLAGDNEQARGFKFRKYSSTTPEDQKWNTQLGMWGTDPSDYMNIEFDYGLTGSDNKNIRFEEAGRYQLTLTGNTLEAVKIPAN